MVVFVVVLDLENYVPTIEPKGNFVWDILFFILGGSVGYIFSLAVEHRTKYPEIIFLMTIVTLSIMMLFLHLYILAIRSILPFVALGALSVIVVKNVLHLAGKDDRSTGQWTYTKK